ncbi:hypothetical protein E4H12_01945 [Candidatus Thorarchaeota archaeon]|nr:MAG: hypothetical protein E4H12_01945 [Candidatus Thorarchaeota archaeon]
MSNEFGTLPPKCKYWFDIIARHIETRGANPDDFDYHPTMRESNYVVRMCKEIADEMGMSIETIMKVERTAAGHVDYHRKFSLYCAELYERNH